MFYYTSKNYFFMISTYTVYNTKPNNTFENDYYVLDM